MDNENTTLKTGYLLKFEPNKRWKIRWLVLHEDQLTCHHRRDKTVIVTFISLHGASVICPCLDDPVADAQGVFKIVLPEGEEIYLQAAGRKDREGWAHAIGAVIRSISGSKQVSNGSVPFPAFRAKVNVSEILGAIQDPDAGVMLANHVRNGAVHKNCFKGSDVVDWLIRWSIVRKRDAGSAMVQTVLKLGHVQEVDINDGAAGASAKFSDDDKLYRFTSLNLGGKRNSYYDSTDSDSESSDEEEENANVDVKHRKGKILRERFLLKRRHIAKDWRVVRVILREKPSTVEYGRAIAQSIASISSAKFIDLEKYDVQMSRKDSFSSGSGSKGKVKKKICLKDKTGKGRCHIFKVKDEEEWYEWNSILQQLTGQKQVTL
ncbi:pleckstrin-like [Ylistrum balloti]|uniref:pleckstrin-like n=1 Tax=Ylistrum balloti TaxID=509963 RepID=UPI0029058F74|nr:pleckstrin-like [Ylistrum balloti]